MSKPDADASILAARVAEDFFTAGPSFRTKARLIELVRAAIIERRERDGKAKGSGGA